MAVEFLTTRVKNLDQDDWGKLCQTIKYLKGTVYLPLILQVDSLNIVRWWVVSLHFAHIDCRGYMGGMTSLGRGGVSSSSRKQKLNAKSSTESELMGIDDILPSILSIMLID